MRLLEIYSCWWKKFLGNEQNCNYLQNQFVAYLVTSCLMLWWFYQLSNSNPQFTVCRRYLDWRWYQTWITGVKDRIIKVMGSFGFFSINGVHIFLHNCSERIKRKVKVLQKSLGTELDLCHELKEKCLFIAGDSACLIIW